MPTPIADSARHYLETHGINILQAMQVARENAVVYPPDQADRSYWDHEIKALHEAVAAAELPPLIDMPINT